MKILNLINKIVDSFIIKLNTEFTRLGKKGIKIIKKYIIRFYLFTTE